MSNDSLTSGAQAEQGRQQDSPEPGSPVRHGFYAYDDREDLAELAHDIFPAPPAARRRVLIEALRVGLVRAKVSQSLVVFLRLIQQLTGEAGLTLYLQLYLWLQPQLSEEAWQTMLTWMEKGVNDDPGAAGGWNRQQLTRFLRICRAEGWQPRPGRIL